MCATALLLDFALIGQLLHLHLAQDLSVLHFGAVYSLEPTFVCA